MVIAVDDEGEQQRTLAHDDPNAHCLDLGRRRVGVRYQLIFLHQRVLGDGGRPQVAFFAVA
jgi:hypothetical protein